MNRDTSAFCSTTGDVDRIAVAVDDKKLNTSNLSSSDYEGYGCGANYLIGEDCGTYIPDGTTNIRNRDPSSEQRPSAFSSCPRAGPIQQSFPALVQLLEQTHSATIPSVRLVPAKRLFDNFLKNPIYIKNLNRPCVTLNLTSKNLYPIFPQ